MNIHLTNEIIEKCRSKKDGIYSHKKIRYRVKNHTLIGYVVLNYCYRWMGFFEVTYRECNGYDDETKALTELK